MSAKVSNNYVKYHSSAVPGHGDLQKERITDKKRTDRGHKASIRRHKAFLGSCVL